MSINYDFWQRLWDEYAPAYLAECRATNTQASLSDFTIYCEEHNLVPDDEAFDV